MNSAKFSIESFKVPIGKTISLKGYDPSFTDGYKDKEEAQQQLHDDIEKLSKMQYKLYAENKQALLIIFQAMDAAGKDGAIKHIFSGVNPQGCEVHNFKSPSVDELDHDYFWRHYKVLPSYGNIGIFNRSHYENVLVTKVHPEILLNGKILGIDSLKDINKSFWENRYKQINSFEKTISQNGTTILKFFLHLSKDEQKRRFMERIENSEKNWKFSISDIKEREYWDQYQEAYGEAISATSKEWAPWYIIPADHKWFSRVVIGSIIVQTLKKMNIKMPTISEKEKFLLESAKEKLLNEK